MKMGRIGRMGRMGAVLLLVCLGACTTTVTPVAALNPMPVKVTVVPPAAGPVVGVIAVMDGAGVTP